MSSTMTIAYELRHDLLHDGHDGHDLMEFAPEHTYHFGAAIWASDGEAGRLVAIVVADKYPWAMTHVGIQMSRFRRLLYFVPVDLVIAATATIVTLSIPVATIERLTSPPSALLLTRSTHVGTPGDGMAGDGMAGKRLGRLAQATIEPEDAGATPSCGGSWTAWESGGASARDHAYHRARDHRASGRRLLRAPDAVPSRR